MSEEKDLEFFYVNVFEVTVGPFDFVFDFGFKTPEQSKKPVKDFKKVCRVAMSPGHAKAMIPLLSNMVANYESQFGIIPTPNFDKEG